MSCKRALLLLISFLFSISLATAQNNKEFSGTVISRQTNLPLEGVSISYPEKNIGSVTNADGKFVISIPSSFSLKDSLIFSSIGYKSQSVCLCNITVNGGLKVQLDTLDITLREVVIKPLSTKELLDSIITHNSKIMASPMQLNGYYRELVFTNDKCTEFSDALCSYYYNKAGTPDGEMRIDASRCRSEKSVADKKDKTYETHIDSRLNPNTLFKYALLRGLLDKFLPEDDIRNYKYDMQVLDNDNDLKITVSPKPDQSKYYYCLVFILKNDFTLSSLSVNIPAYLLGMVREKSLIGIHFKITQLQFNIDYAASANTIYPQHFKVNYTGHLWGKLLGTSMDEIINQQSEFVSGDAHFNDITAYKKSDVFKKGNICGNGQAMNDDLLKGHTFIVPSAKDSVAIKSLN